MSFVLAPLWVLRDVDDDAGDDSTEDDIWQGIFYVYFIILILIFSPESIERGLL